MKNVRQEDFQMDCSSVIILIVLKSMTGLMVQEDFALSTAGVHIMQKSKHILLLKRN